MCAAHSFVVRLHVAGSEGSSPLHPALHHVPPGVKDLCHCHVHRRANEPGWLKCYPCILLFESVYVGKKSCRKLPSPPELHDLCVLLLLPLAPTIFFSCFLARFGSSMETTKNCLRRSEMTAILGPTRTCFRFSFSPLCPGSPSPTRSLPSWIGSAAPAWSTSTFPPKDSTRVKGVTSCAGKKGSSLSEQQSHHWLKMSFCSLAPQSRE